MSRHVGEVCSMHGPYNLRGCGRMICVALKTQGQVSLAKGAHSDGTQVLLYNYGYDVLIGKGVRYIAVDFYETAS